MFDRFFKREIKRAEKRDIKDGIPVELYDEAIKLLQEAKANGRKQFVVATMDTDKEGVGHGVTYAKVMSDGNFPYIVLGMLKEYMERHHTPGMEMMAQIITAMFSGAEVDVAAEFIDGEPKKETIN